MVLLDTSRPLPVIIPHLQRQHPLDAVGPVHPHAVAALDAPRHQARGERRHFLRHLAVGLKHIRARLPLGDGPVAQARLPAVALDGEAERVVEGGHVDGREAVLGDVAAVDLGLRRALALGGARFADRDGEARGAAAGRHGCFWFCSLLVGGGAFTAGGLARVESEARVRCLCRERFGRSRELVSKRRRSRSDKGAFRCVVGAVMSHRSAAVALDCPCSGGAKGPARGGRRGARAIGGSWALFIAGAPPPRARTPATPEAMRRVPKKVIRRSRRAPDHPPGGGGRRVGAGRGSKGKERERGGRCGCGGCAVGRARSEASSGRSHLFEYVCEDALVCKAPAAVRVCV